MMRLIAALVLLSTVVEASERHRIHYLNFTVLRLNPQGLQNQFDLGYRYKLFDSDSILFKTSHAGAGLATMISPGLAKVGAFAEVEPVAVLKLTGKWEWVQYFGTFGHMRTLPDVDGDYSDTAIETAKDNDEALPPSASAAASIF